MTGPIHSRKNVIIAIGLKVLEWLLYVVLRIVHKVARKVLHCVLTVFYFNRGHIVPPIKNELLFKSATQLAADIREKRLKCEDVIQAYIERIEEVDPLINATTHRRFAEALREARLVDELIETGQMSRKQLTTEKPLLGVPLSVKLNIKINGAPFTSGSIDLKDVVATEDADAIRFMKKAGAIVLVSTNAPEKGLNVETINNLYGRTNNPYNTSRTVGGSSGGEGALLAAGGSVMGLGNDTAGSLRIPAHYCGIFSHMPSANIVSPHGQLFNTGNFTTIGPMCRYAEDLVMAMRVLTMDKGNVLKLDRKVDFTKIKLHYFNEIDISFSVPVQEEIRQAIAKVTSYFKSSYGVKANEVKIPLLKESRSMFYHKLLAATDLEEAKEVLSIPKDTDMAKELLKCLIGLSKYTFNVPFLFKFCKSFLWYRPKDVLHYESLARKLEIEFDELLDEDSVLICPTLPQTALHHGEVQLISFDLCCMTVWNLLGLPSTHCPVGFNEQGLPFGLQVVSRKNNDALTLAVALELEKVFGGWVPPRKK